MKSYFTNSCLCGALYVVVLNHYEDGHHCNGRVNGRDLSRSS